MPTKPDLYNHDFYAWTQQQAALLRDEKTQALDYANLAEEIESLGRSDDKREHGQSAAHPRHASPQVVLPAAGPRGES